MNRSFLVFIGLLSVILVVLLARNQRRSGILEDTRRASVALAAVGDEIQFEWKYESCPPENSGVFAEWTRRLADAKASSSRASELLGSDDPDVRLLTAGIFNQVVLLSERRIACLETQGKVLDDIRAWQRR